MAVTTIQSRKGNYIFRRRAEVDKLSRESVICESKRESNDYLSNVFTRNKKDGGKRMFLN